MTSPDTTVFLIRHPQTIWNAESRYQGTLNPPLSELGKRQAAAIVDLVTPDAFSAVYTSPLQRAGALAAEIAENARAPLCVDDRLVEIAMGPWQGLTRREIAEKFPDLLKRWYERPDYVTFPDGESLRDVAERISRFLGDVFDRRESTTLAVVTHDVCVKVAVMLAIGLELRHLHDFQLRNASISILRGSRLAGSVLAVNVTTHLTGSPLVLPQ